MSLVEAVARLGEGTEGKYEFWLEAMEFWNRGVPSGEPLNDQFAGPGLEMRPVGVCTADVTVVPPTPGLNSDAATERCRWLLGTCSVLSLMPLTLRGEGECGREGALPPFSERPEARLVRPGAAKLRRKELDRDMDFLTGVVGGEKVAPVGLRSSRCR